MPSQQAKNWCWTLNNWTEDEQAALQALGQELPEEIVYIVWGREGTQENQTPHLQGYVSLNTKKGLNYVKGLISDRSHQEVTKGTPKQAAEYCKKEGDWEEYGTLPVGKGKRTDLSQIAKKIKEGASLRSLAEDHPEAILRYGSGVLRLKQHYRVERKGAPEIWVLWGKTGTGKSRRV
jgi:hypothetical protein